MPELSEITQARLRAAVVAIAPVVVLVAFLYHPYIGDLTDEAAVAREVAADTTRWGWAHLLNAVGLGLTVLSVFAIRTYLRAAGEHVWSFVAVPLVGIGGTLIAFMNGSDLAVLAAVEAGAPVEAVIEAAGSWELPTFLVAAVMFGLGWLSLAVSVVRSGVLSRELTWAVAAALVVLTIALFIPAGWAFYVIGVAAVIALWPLAHQMWLDTTETPVVVAGPSPA